MPRQPYPALNIEVVDNPAQDRTICAACIAACALQARSQHSTALHSAVHLCKACMYSPRALQPTQRKGGLSCSSKTALRASSSDCSCIVATCITGDALHARSWHKTALCKACSAGCALQTKSQHSTAQQCYTFKQSMQSMPQVICYKLTQQT